MKIYLVGGAVRDALLGIADSDSDWVVVGATVEEMLALGYQQVGKDFPVFLHPESKEEYALARSERKVGKGYYGFEWQADATVSLEEDLKRRDLSINAMAKDQSGVIIDPYGGQEDLNNRVLRHVSEAFVEDPVRVLRLARFAARFIDFSVHEATLQLMQQMSAAGQMRELIVERIWKEMEKALNSNAPWRFFAILHQANAIDDVVAPWQISNADIERLQHGGASEMDAALFVLLRQNTEDQLCLGLRRLKVPNRVQRSVLLACRYHSFCMNPLPRAEDYARLFKHLDILRRKDSLADWVRLCSYVYADLNGDLIKAAAQAYADVDIAPLLQQSLSGSDLAQAISDARLQAVQLLLEG